MKEIFDLMQEQATKNPKDLAAGDATEIPNPESRETETQSKVVNVSIGDPLPASASDIPPIEELKPTSPTPSVPVQKPASTTSVKPKIRQQPQAPPATVGMNSSSTGLLIFIFTAIFLALLWRRLTSLQ